MISTWKIQMSFKKVKYRFLYQITFGETRQHYKKKLNNLKKKNYIELIPNAQNRKFITYDERPVYASDYRAMLSKIHQKCYIMMQGPLLLENDFTLETIKLYKQTFPGCPIVVSTWNSENSEVLEKIKQEGAELVLTSLPQFQGYSHVNCQIVSTQNGLNRVKELGGKYVIKTRTDQRLYETNIPEYLFNILKLFPVEDPKLQHKRLVAMSFNTFKYRLYDISDMFLFGHIDDVIKFWDCPLETRDNLPECKNVLEYSKLCAGEIYFTTQYLKKLGQQLHFTLSDSWKMYAKYFCIIDSDSLGFYWPKYTNRSKRWRNFFGWDDLLEELTFKEWLGLYLNSKKSAPEEIISKTSVLKPTILRDKY